MHVNLIRFRNTNLFLVVLSHATFETKCNRFSYREKLELALDSTNIFRLMTCNEVVCKL